MNARQCVPLQRQRGFSLVEIAIALVIVGMLTIAFVAYWKSAAQQRTTVAEHDILTIADQSLQGFAQAQFRLPCPDTNNDGSEDCASGVALGTLPWKTLGIADLRARGLRYGVYRNTSATDPWKNADLATAQDRFRALMITIAGWPSLQITSTESLLGNSNLLDFCTALANASGAASSASQLYLATLDAGGAEVVAYRRNVAYVLAAHGLLDADGDGNRFDGFQATQTAANPVFDSPSRPHSVRYDDQVRAASFDQLFATLSCGPALAAAGHAHFNAAASAEVTRQYLLDYQKLMDLSAEMAAAGVASGAATVAGAAAGLATATALSTTALADAILTYGATTAIIASGVAAVVANTAAVAAAAGTLAVAITAKTLADQRVTEIAPIVTDASALAADVLSNAKAADATGF